MRRRKAAMRRLRRFAFGRSGIQHLEVRMLLSATTAETSGTFAAVDAEYTTYLVLLDEPDTALRSRDPAQLAEQHSAFAAHLDHVFEHSVHVPFDYTNVFNGVALLLTDQQAQQVAEMPTVTMVLPDASSELQGNSAELTGAANVWNGSATGGVGGTFGEGVLIGIIDSGIDFDNASFAAVGPNDGYVHVNPFGDGVYIGMG
ncbi:MAG: hypothetical protein GY826_35020, partial [Fuerstiella sp.]|nr:hypothetical protein [Fuerstiella sp.]